MAKTASRGRAPAGTPARVSGLSTSQNIAKLALETGAVFEGESIGADGTSEGEVVFNTSLSGYQEIFTDPSYNGQMVLMTNPLIGNYGINADDEESFRPHVRGVIVRELSRHPSNFRSESSLGAYLKKYNVVGIAGIDTRAVTKLLRISGSLKGVIATGERGDAELDDSRLTDRARSWKGLGGVDMVAEVSCDKVHRWVKGFTTEFSPGFKANGTGGAAKVKPPGHGLRIAAFDYGIKHNILRILHEMGFDVSVLPATATADEARALKPDGIFLSNGPGDPEGLPYAVKTVRSLLGEYPTFGICLGHQLTALALGGKTYKLKFGHHGGNHPVKNLQTGKVEISVQNHCYAVEPASLPKEMQPLFLNLNDQSNEGLVHTKLPIFTVQFHPEASPGPNDFTFLFDQFARIVRERRPLSSAIGTREGR
ncbi:MAG TPA: glutamine-hydrolyzing carbamoyl-phosphate synthase small subunit [Planctomycetota bacterium]|nr:glutamine-hydrolyzing carbamoyl-phosphate synthase small subunit [Planctomycetota bacterium]